VLPPLLLLYCCCWPAVARTPQLAAVRAVRRTPCFRLAELSDRLLASPPFATFMNGAFVLSLVLVGAQTYPALQSHRATIALDFATSAAFCLELGARVVSQGLAPWRFFSGPGAPWNVFDLCVTVVSMPSLEGAGGGSAAASQVFRMARLLRLAQIVRRFPKLGHIIVGLAGSVGSIGYIVLLLLLALYLFAIAGYYGFGVNDPYHFGTLQRALLTLYRAATLDAWSEIMYINYFGCDVYPGSVYSGGIDRWAPLRWGVRERILRAGMRVCARVRVCACACACACACVCARCGARTWVRFYSRC
jgi:Ion transport protein